MDLRDSNTGSDEDSKRSRRTSFLSELKNRQVYQAAGAYAVVAWGVTEILDGVITRFGWPDWLATLVVILFVVGFPVAMFLAWVFDWTPRGIRRDQPWTAMGWVSFLLAGVFLVGGSAGLFWLINPGGVAHLEQVGIAVLPCRYRGEERYVFRAEGFTESVIHRLSYTELLRVPAMATVLHLSAQTLGTGELARRAGVEWLVECRIAQDAERWQIDVSLVDVNRDESRLVVSLEPDGAGFYGALDSVVHTLFVELGLPISESLRQRWTELTPARARYFDAYLQGEQAMRLGTVGGFRAARKYFRSAQDGPGFELARVREADAFMAMLEADPPPSARERAAAVRAVALMLDAAEARKAALAELYAARMRLALLTARMVQDEVIAEDRMRRWFERAVELRPSFAEPYRLLAGFLEAKGEAGEARDLSQRARVLDPEP